MWEVGTNTAPMASLHAVTHGIHVLLVDHDAEALILTAKQLEMCRYRVTYVEHASAAIAMLPDENAKFDVVMANINSPDLHGLKLLQHAVYLCIPVVLLADDDDAFMAMRALEHGALLYMKKPLRMEFLRSLWQHVVREKTRMVKEREKFIAANNHGPAHDLELREMIHPKNENPNPNTMMKNKGKHKGKGRGRYDAYNGEEYVSAGSHMVNRKGNLRRKMCTEWTQELHAKFMNAVEKLGEGRCFPKEILDMMNEPGLTRMQVASHLQKCRNDNWRAPEERKLSHQSTQQATSSGSDSQPKPRRFGSKPLVNKPSSGQSSETLSDNQTPRTGSKVGNGWNAPRQGSDEYFDFLNIECPTRDIPGGHQEPETSNAGRAYNNEQNESGEASCSRTKSLWSSDTSNLEGDHSETKPRPY